MPKEGGPTGNDFERERTREKQPGNAERQPENRWFLDEEKDIVEIVRVDKDGHEHRSSEREYVKGKYGSSDLNISLYEDDTKLIITPHHIESFAKRVNIPHATGTTDKMHVGIVDGKFVRFLAWEWTTADGRSKVDQYYFKKDGSPDGAYVANISGPWPANRGRVITDMERLHYAGLAEFLSDEALGSLAHAVNVLSEPAKR